jgi:hypothetical protein
LSATRIRASGSRRFNRAACIQQAALKDNIDPWRSAVIYEQVVHGASLDPFEKSLSRIR